LKPVSKQVRPKVIALTVAKIFGRMAVFALGIGLGAFGTVQTMDYLDMGVFAEARAAFDAFDQEMTRRINSAEREESPEVVTWAMHAYIDGLEEYFSPGDCDGVMPDLLVYWYGRLARVRKGIGDGEGYERHMTRAVDIAKSCGVRELQTEQEILALLEKRRTP
jgi:hypothetical protein